MRRVGTLAVVSLLAVTASASYAALAGAGAAGCGSTISISGPKGGTLLLSPSSAKVAIGDCLAFSNDTNNTVNIAITRAGSGVFSDTLSKGAVEGVSDGFTPKNTGSDTIAVSSHLLLLKFTGSGSVTVSPAPKSSPSPSKSPTPGGGKGGGGGGHHSAKPTHKPNSTPTPHKSASHTPTPHATGYKLPPLPPLPSTGSIGNPLPKGSSPIVAPGLTSAVPVTTDSSTPVAAIVAGPLEPVEDTSRGLPIAVAVLVVLGLASGYGRVLLATPGTTTATAGRQRPKRPHRTKRFRRIGGAGNDSAVDNRHQGDHRV